MQCARGIPECTGLGAMVPGGFAILYAGYRRDHVRMAVRGRQKL